MVNSLHDTDFNLWLETTVSLLEQGAFLQLDIKNLIEEIEDMGRNDKRALEQNLIRVLQHLLKWKYQPEKRTNSWKASITEHSLRLNRAFKQSPSLRKYFDDVFEECYSDAKLITSQETGLEVGVFPEASPFAKVDILNPQYLPDQ
ncbi:DUF29 domain-containing protein [Cronbergia sp. UHCC 0137]|uniref:DUF29 domain-containing protein n=1 Tax=Cronbergia sp. UHCC 0137 TaxID=3110239 RepID=UPI002B1EBE91|nr:DUF29 domain-containing protein [Cronbergia sp. UHCC 0137]MEA5620668.1 DUF29 domain-containing protein [Cronbergia sp. UHCC 0137]